MDDDNGYLLLGCLLQVLGAAIVAFSVGVIVWGVLQ